ncbi:MAG: murein biosynthesis integral membrane protein MurJ [Bryobacterales bacterium]|nr:murein biosynthesis integral membrane protein MurJ [Bryobacterales bacterium]
MPEAQSEGVARSAGMMSVAVMFSRITGLLREQVMAWQFGTGMDFEAYRLGFTLPNLTRDLFAEGALSSAFVPTFTEYLATKGKEEAARLANLVATAVVLLVGLICLLGWWFAPQLVDLFGSGFRQTPGKHELAVHMARIMFPFLLLVALAAQAMGILNACNQFGIPALASSLFNVISVGSGLILGVGLGPWLGIQPIEGMAWGVLLGGAGQLLWQVPSLLQKGFSFRPMWDTTHPGLRQIFRMMGPAILGSAAVNINLAVNLNFASMVVDAERGANGPMSWLNYAFRFIHLPIGVFGVAVASATVPSITRSLASGNTDEFRRTLSRSLGVVLLMSLPSAVGLYALGKDIVRMVYQHGRFTANDTEQTAFAMSCYAIGLVGYAGAKVLTPAFYALKDSRTPMLLSFSSIVVNYAAAWAMMRFTRLGHAGLALTTSVVATFSFLGLLWLLRQRVGSIHGRELASTTGRALLAALGMGAALTLLVTGLERLLGNSLGASAVRTAVCIPAGALVFYFVCRALRVAELPLAVSGLLAPLQRWVPGLRGRVV